jgi:hypothetical protein
VYGGYKVPDEFSKMCVGSNLVDNEYGSTDAQLERELLRNGDRSVPSVWNYTQH